MSTLAVDLVRDDAGLAALAPEWERLWRAAPDATPFQSPAWLLAWWEVFGTGAPRVAVLRDGGGRLVGLLALYVLTGEGKVLPMGAGLSDYHDALLAGDAPDDAASVLLRVALRDVTLPCDLTELAPNAALRRATPPPGWRAETHAGEACPVLALGADLRATIPPGQHRNVRQSRHRADAAGGWRHGTATDATRAEMLEALWRLHAARWGAPDPALRRFHAAAIPRLCAAGAMRLEAVRVGGEITAVFQVLRGPRAAMCYVGGFDAAFAAVSPGTLLFAAIIEDAIADGLGELHFLRGGEPYKYAWGALDRRNATICLRRG